MLCSLSEYLWWSHFVLFWKPLSLFCLDYFLLVCWSSLACFGCRLKCLCPDQWSGSWDLFFQFVFWQWLVVTCLYKSTVIFVIVCTQARVPSLPLLVVFWFYQPVCFSLLLYTVYLIQVCSSTVNCRCMVEF